MTEVFDVVVCGGGPAGSTCASYLAMAGLNVLVVERDFFPRPHVGESLVPATTPVLREIGAFEAVASAGFPRKYGAAWTTAETRDIPANGFAGLSHDWTAQVEFRERPQPDVDVPYTFHVDRAQFDLLLLKNAERNGAKVLQGVRVVDTDHDPQGRTTGEFVTVGCKIGRNRFDLRARMFVDASGRLTLLGNQRGTKLKDPVFDQFAVHSWFEGLDRRLLARHEREIDYIVVHFLPQEDSWVWQIPISDTVTSVGVVSQRGTFNAAGLELEEYFWKSVGSRPDLEEALRATTRVRPFRSEGDYSYSMTDIIGDNMVLIGDAARFVDPIFSSGVSIALNSARFASSDIVDAFHKGNLGRDAFVRYDEKMRVGAKNWHEFIGLYYRLNVLFTAFVQDPRYRLETLKLLQGDVFEESEALTEMRLIAEAVEADPTHLWHPYLGSLRMREPIHPDVVKGVPE